jgi:hypothetical protein
MSPTGSIFQGKSAAFTSKFSSVWAHTNDMMFHDTRMDLKSQDRHARTVLANLERQVHKIERVKNKDVKNKMLMFYN